MVKQFTPLTLRRYTLSQLHWTLSSYFELTAWSWLAFDVQSLKTYLLGQTRSNPTAPRNQGNAMRNASASCLLGDLAEAQRRCGDARMDAFGGLS